MFTPISNNPLGPALRLCVYITRVQIGILG